MLKRGSYISNEYDEDIKIAVTDDEKLTAIAKMIQHIAQAHPFEDCNIRTAYISLNKLLRDHGLHLSILLDPNRLDCCDLELVVTMIKEGQRIYLSLRRHTNPIEFQAVTTDSYFQTIICPPYDIGSALCDVFLHDIVLKDSLPQQDTHPSAFFKPASNQKIIDAFTQLQLKNEACRPLISKHVITENYETALRNACFHRELAAIHFLLAFFPSLNLNGQSKNGNTALDWLNQHAPDDELDAVLARLGGLGALTQEKLLKKSP